MTSVVFDVYVYLPYYKCNRSYLLYCVYPTVHVQCLIGLHFHLRSYVTPVIYQCIVNLHHTFSVSMINAYVLTYFILARQVVALNMSES